MKINKLVEIIVNRFVLLLLILLSFGCSEKNSKWEFKGNYEKMVMLDHGFTVIFLQKENLGHYETFWDTKIYKDENLILTDSLTEYEVRENYPSVRKIGEKYEMLLLINDRPSINLSELLIVYKNKVELRTQLPSFRMDPVDIDNDGKFELLGVLSHSETFGKNYESMAYNPVLVYELGEKGIALDSLETKRINEQIYGDFYGYNYNANHIVGAENDNKIERLLDSYKQKKN